MKNFALKHALLVVLSFEVILCTRIDSSKLPDGKSSIIRGAGGDATTTLYLEATAPLAFPQGILTSTVDTFINDGTTTEYMTQHIGSTVSDVYAKIQTTSSREYYRIAPTASQNYNAPARPTGLIGSSTSLDIHGPVSTYYTIEEYRTYVDGHYAHLVSSITNVVTDIEKIQPTPTFEYDGYLKSEDKLAEQRIKDSVFSSYGIGSNPSIHAAVTRTIGSYFDQRRFQEEIDNEINDPGTVKRPRQIDLDDLVAIESEANEIEIDPSKPVAALPTFTVDSNGHLNIPTPKIEVLSPVTEKQKPARQHRFLQQDKPDKSSMDSVTYIGFVDFTTTIDDTVVIFKPKNNYNTATKNIFPTRIEPTSSFTPSFTSSARPAIGQVKSPKAFNFNARPGLNVINEDKEDRKETKQKSGINALKDLLSSSAALRSSVYNPASRSRFSLAPTSTVPVAVSPTSRPRGEVDLPNTTPELEGSTVSPIDLLSSIDPTADIELVIKTMYTTYTYYTTLIKGDEEVVKSREEIFSNVFTQTNTLKSTDLPAISSSCELDSSCLFATDGFIGRPNSKEEPRGQDGRPVSFNIIDDNAHKGTDGLKTFYTTYTHLKTLHAAGTSSVSTITEIYSNVHSEDVPRGVITPVTEILPTSSARITLISEASISPSRSSISAFPVRRLEVSSIRDRQLQRELTTPESVDDTTTESVIDKETVFTVDAIEASTVQTDTTEADEDNQTDSATSETPGLTEDVTEVLTVATTESEVETGTESALNLPLTIYTTFTYFTTFFKDGTTTLVTNEETSTNVVTDNIVQTEIPETSVTVFTTLTFFTTSIDSNDNSVVVSNEKTITNVIPSSQFDIQNGGLLNENGADIAPSTPTNNVIEQTVFTLPPSGITEELDGSQEFSSVVPVLQSSEGEEDKSTSDNLSTSSTFALTSSKGFDNDDDFVLTTESSDADEEDDEEKESKPRGTVRPSRVRINYSKPGNTFTPDIRPILGNNRNAARLFKPSRIKASTTVATRTRNSVKPTLIATPASSAVNTPLFNPTSRLFSSNLLSRGGSRFSSSQFRISSSPVSASSSSINPSAVQARGSVTFTASEAVETTSPKVVISPFNFNRKVNPFRARLQKLQQQRLKKLQEKNSIKSKTTDQEKEKEAADDDTPKSLPIPNFNSLGSNAPIFVSSQRQFITSRPNSNTESPIEIPDDIAARQQRARERIRSLFGKRRASSLSRQKRQQSGERF